MPNIYSIPGEYFYRCAFPRGRLLSEIEDDLTLFAQLIIKNAHKSKEDFERDFDSEYKGFHSGIDKTIQNHRTEMIALYGLAFSDLGGRIEPSVATLKLVEEQDYYRFFKIFCSRFQFPNCINKPQVAQEEIEKGVKFKPAKFILKLLKAGNEKSGSSFSVTGPEISNLVFNDLRVTTGKRSEVEVLATLVKNREEKIRYDFGSNATQHGREFLGYMSLANLLKYDENSRSFFLNTDEISSIELIISDGSFFDFPKNFPESVDIRKETYLSWSQWWGKTSENELAAFKTGVSSFPQIVEQTASLGPKITEGIPQPQQKMLTDIGNLGERIVLKYEREKIKNIRPDKVSLVQLVSNDSVLGFDVQSLEFDDLNRKKLIEVKTTNRTYPPNIDILTSFPMSSNEWETAKTYKENYYIYRVFLVSKSVKVFVVKNPADKESQGLIFLEPTEYRVNLKHGCGCYIEDVGL